MNWFSVFSFTHKGLQKTIEISGKPMEVTCTARAMRVLAERQEPLIVEMELAFACFVRKTVHFPERTEEQNLIHVTDKLTVYARSVIPDNCDVSTGGKPVNTTTLAPGWPSLAPQWLKLDYVDGKWTGEYGL